MPYDVSKLWSQKDIEQSIEGWGATEYYSVTGTPTELADNLNLLIAPGIPAIGQSHPTRRDLRVMSKQAGSGLAERIISVRYAWLPNGLPTGGSSGNLLSQAPTISWSMATRLDSIGTDVYGNLITNSAGDVVDPPPTIQKYSRILEIQRYETEYRPEIADRFEGTTNSKDIIAGGRRFPAATVLCQTIFPVESYTPDADAILVSYRFEVRTLFFRANGGNPTSMDKFPFRFWHADMGLRSFYAVSGVPDRVGDIYGKNGTALGDQIDVPVRLENGKPMNSSDYLITSLGKEPTVHGVFPKKDGPLIQTITTPIGNTNFIGWRIYPGEDFQELGL